MVDPATRWLTKAAPEENETFRPAKASSRSDGGASPATGCSGSKTPGIRSSGPIIRRPTVSAVSMSSVSATSWPLPLAMSTACVSTSNTAMLSATAPGISPNGSFTVLSSAPGCSNAVIARCAAVAQAACGSSPRLSPPPMSRPRTSSGTDPCSAEIANIVAPPVMWLITSRTVHPSHGDGFPS